MSAPLTPEELADRNALAKLDAFEDRVAAVGQHLAEAWRLAELVPGVAGEEIAERIEQAGAACRRATSLARAERREIEGRR